MQHCQTESTRIKLPILTVCLLCPPVRVRRHIVFPLACIRPFACVSRLSNMTISETNMPIPIKFYLKHNWCGGKGCIRFSARSDQVSMATDSSHREVGKYHTRVATLYIIFICSRAGNSINSGGMWPKFKLIQA